MSSLLKVGDKVCARAILFDERGSKTLWSKSVFGRDYKTAVCHGTIINIVQSRATVLWDIDGLRMDAKLKQLRKLKGNKKFFILVGERKGSE